MEFDTILDTVAPVQLRLALFGHLRRLPSNIHAALTMALHTAVCLRQRGRHHNTSFGETT